MKPATAAARAPPLPALLARACKLMSAMSRRPKVAGEVWNEALAEAPAPWLFLFSAMTSISTLPRLTLLPATPTRPATFTAPEPLLLPNAMTEMLPAVRLPAAPPSSRCRVRLAFAVTLPWLDVPSKPEASAATTMSPTCSGPAAFSDASAPAFAAPPLPRAPALSVSAPSWTLPVGKGWPSWILSRAEATAFPWPWALANASTSMAPPTFKAAVAWRPTLASASAVPPPRLTALALSVREPMVTSPKSGGTPGRLGVRASMSVRAAAEAKPAPCSSATASTRTLPRATCTLKLGKAPSLPMTLTAARALAAICVIGRMGDNGYVATDAHNSGRESTLRQGQSRIRGRSCPAEVMSIGRDNDVACHADCPRTGSGGIGKSLRRSATPVPGARDVGQVAEVQVGRAEASADDTDISECRSDGIASPMVTGEGLDGDLAKIQLREVAAAGARRDFGKCLRRPAARILGARNVGHGADAGGSVASTGGEHGERRGEGVARTMVARGGLDVDGAHTEFAEKSPAARPDIGKSLRRPAVPILGARDIGQGTDTGAPASAADGGEGSDRRGNSIARAMVTSARGR